MTGLERSEWSGMGVVVVGVAMLVRGEGYSLLAHGFGWDSGWVGS